MSLILIASHRFTEHETPPGHPERSERAEVMDVIANRWRERGGEVVVPRAATLEQLERIHDAAYVRRIFETAGHAVSLDPDTYTSPETSDIALLAAGATVDAVERVMSASDRSALAMVRPPGHHAERAKAMGFCFFNNVAVAAAHARTLGARKVAIVDYDVHHGNGTQHSFEADPERAIRVNASVSLLPGNWRCRRGWRWRREGLHDRTARSKPAPSARITGSPLQKSSSRS